MRVSTLAATSQSCKHHKRQEAVKPTSCRPDLTTPLNVLTRRFRVIVDERVWGADGSGSIWPRARTGLLLDARHGSRVTGR